MPVGIIGTRGCGKSTVIGLLYQAMTIYTNAHPNEFRFYMRPNDLKKVADQVRNRMLRGKFPIATQRNIKEETSILLGFKPRSTEVLRAWKNNLIAFKEYNFRGLGMLLRVYDVSGEDVEEYSTTQNININPHLKNIFDSNILILLIDCKKFTNTTRGDKWDALLDYDKECAVIASAYIEYRYRNKRNEKIHPIYLFTKVDEMDKEIKEEFGVEKIENAKMYDEKVCSEIGNKLLQKYMSQTRAILIGSEQVTVPLHETRKSLPKYRPKYFFSWVGLENIEGIASEDSSEEGPRLKVIEIKEKPFRNDFPGFMYEAMLEHIMHIAEEKGGDPRELCEELMNVPGAVIQTDDQV